jgi:hypothetical protein
MGGETATAHPLKAFASGTASGLACCFLFNPWDKALYLSVKTKTAFLHRSNWQAPFQGVTQALAHRTISGGLYFPLNDMLREPYAKLLKPKSDVDRLIVHTLAGNTAGAIQGLLLNPLTAVKFQCWGDESSNWWQTAKRMVRKGGVVPFLNGMAPTVARDSVFGGVFAGMKFGLNMLIVDNTSPGDQQPIVSFMVSLAAASCACVASSPLNYARNMQYATQPGTTPETTQHAVYRLFSTAMKREAPLAYLQDRLRLGWGTLRVACGMAAGFEIYRACMERL